MAVRSTGLTATVMQRAPACVSAIEQLTKAGRYAFGSNTSRSLCIKKQPARQGYSERMRYRRFGRVGGVHEMFHIFRIDHVLGFYRIYAFPWRPERNKEFLPLSREQMLVKTGGREPELPGRDRPHEPSDAELAQLSTFEEHLTTAASTTTGPNELVPRCMTGCR